MTLKDLGYNDKMEQFQIEHGLIDIEIARVISEHKERYIVKTLDGEFDAKITGTMRFAAQNSSDFPAVGDWVSITFDNGKAIIKNIFPRFSTLKRQAVGQQSDIQMIATNIDYALLVQAVDRDFNINRLERYLAICNSSKVKPIIVLTKIDLVDEMRIAEIINSLRTRIKNVPIVPITNQTLTGYETINTLMEYGKTFCMLGSSGVGKSTLLNKLSAKALMNTGAISQSTNKGRHVTSHRELVLLENGGILIDNPGMREVAVADMASGLETTFDDIARLSENCKYKDCTHRTEKGCAILEAIEKGEIDTSSYKNYLKLESEKAHFGTTSEEKRRKDKDFGKMLKNFKNNLKR